MRIWRESREERHGVWVGVEAQDEVAILDRVVREKAHGEGDI